MDTQKLQLALAQLLAANRTLLPVIEAVAELVLEAARQAQTASSIPAEEKIEVAPLPVSHGPPLSQKELEDAVGGWGPQKVQVEESVAPPILLPKKLAAEHRTELRALLEGMQQRQLLLAAILERRKQPAQLSNHWIADLFPGKNPRPYQELYQAQAVVILASELVLQSNPADTHLRDQLEYLVEAQSMLRAASYRFLNRDEEQYQYFQLLKKITGDLGLYFDRYMRVNDIADLAGLPALQRRLEKALVPYRERDLLRQLRENPEAPAGQVEVWLTQLEALGVPPQDERIGAILEGRGYAEPLPLLSEALLALHEDEDFPETGQVSLVSPLLQGRQVCLIGGEPNPASIARLEEELGCSIRWIEWEGHLSIDRLELEVRGSNLVLLLIRWIAHSYGDISHFCKENNIPLVRLPAGYGVNRVAYEVERQVGKKLTALAG